MLSHISPVATLGPSRRSQVIDSPAAEVVAVDKAMLTPDVGENRGYYTCRTRRSRYGERRRRQARLFGPPCVWPSAGDRNRTVVVLVTYLDDSGTDRDSPVVTMAGYVAGFEEWKSFEGETEMIFDRYGICLFHSKEFHDTKCQFGEWSRIKKTTFVDEWYDAASPLIPFGISISAQKKTYDLRKLQTGLGQNMSAFGVCFNVVIDRLLREPEIGRLVASEGLSFIVESGTTYNSSLDRIFHSVMRQHHLETRLESISFADKKQCKALQLADLLSFHAKRHFVQCK